MPTHYTSFRLKNPTTAPMIIQVNDPDGSKHAVGTVAPGEESLQVAPISATWSITQHPASLDNLDSHAQDRQAGITPANAPSLSPEEVVSPVQNWPTRVTPIGSSIETKIEIYPPPSQTSTKSALTDYEVFLRINTGSHSSRIRQLLVTPDNKTLISAGDDKTIRVWDIETKTEVRKLLGQIGSGDYGNIQAIALSPDGNYVVALVWLNPEGTHEDHYRETDVRVYELATGNMQAGFRFPGALQDLDFSPDGNYIAMVGNPKDTVRRGYVRVYDTKAILRGFDKAPAPVASNQLYDYDALIPAYVRCVPDDREKSTGFQIVVATWYQNYPAREPDYEAGLLWYSWSPADGMNTPAKLDLQKELNLQQFLPESLAVSHQFVAVSSHPQDSNVDKKKIYCYRHGGQPIEPVSCESRPVKLGFSQDGSQLIVGQSGDGLLGQVKVHDTALGKFHLQCSYYGHDDEVTAVALLQDGTAVSAGGNQNEIHFWNTTHTEGVQTGVIKGVGRDVHAVGINELEQIGIGNRDDLLLDDESTGDEGIRIVLQRLFDLRSMTLRSLSIDDASSFRRAQKRFGNRELKWMEVNKNPNLYLLPDGVALTWLPGDGWYSASTYGFTETGTVVTGASDGKIRVAPLKPDGTYNLPRRLLIGHTAEVLDHAACGRWLVTAGADQIIRLWYLADVEQNVMTDLDPALNLFVGSDDEWVIWSKSGYYNASAHGDRYVGFHVNRGSKKEALFFSSDRFQDVFYKPEIIRAILRYGSEEAVSENRPELGIKIGPVDIEKILPPIIELEEGGVRIVESKDTNQEFVTFTVGFESHGKEIKRLCVLRNGRLLPIEQRSLRSNGKITLSSIPLVPGKNRFKIFAEIQDEQSHTIKSNPIETTIPGKIRYEDKPILENGTLYILAIGVSTGKYLRKRTNDDETGTFELDYAHTDAEAIYNVFKNNKAFEEVYGNLLVNEQATLSGINNALMDIVQKIYEKIEDGKEAKRDVLLVYLSGHGVCRIIDQQLYFKKHRKFHVPDQQLCFWNWDLEPGNPDKTGLAFLDLGEKITSLPVEVILMTDACHSGIVGSEVARGFDSNKDGIDPNELAKRIYGINETEMYILNASRRSEYAQENSKIKHGYFTKAILDALPISANSELTMLGLIDQVQRGVQRYTTAQNSVCRMYGDLLPLEIYKR